MRKKTRMMTKRSKEGSLANPKGMGPMNPPMANFVSPSLSKARNVMKKPNRMVRMPISNNLMFTKNL